MFSSDRDYSHLSLRATFASTPKLLAHIINMIMQNERLLKLLYWTDKAALKCPKLTQEQQFSLINNQIRLAPDIDLQYKQQVYLLIVIKQMVPINATGTRSIIISFTTICNKENWMLEDFEVRPLAIIGELEGMFDKFAFKFGPQLNGIGNSLGVDLISVEERAAGYVFELGLTLDGDKQERRGFTDE